MVCYSTDNDVFCFCICQHGEAIEAALCSVILHTEESLQWKKEHCFNSLKTALANVPQVRLILGMVQGRRKVLRMGVPCTYSLKLIITYKLLFVIKENIILYFFTAESI